MDNMERIPRVKRPWNVPMHVYEASELTDALKEVGVTDPAIVECKAVQIDDAALLFLTQRQAESASPPHKVIQELEKISRAARKICVMLQEGADPDHVLDEGDVRRAANRRMWMVSNRMSERLGELGERQLTAFIREWYEGKFASWVTNRAFDLALQGTALIQSWAEGALNVERHRKSLRAARPPRPVAR